MTKEQEAHEYLLKEAEVIMFALKHLARSSDGYGRIDAPRAIFMLEAIILRAKG